jgi:hypothetical protein
LQHQGLQAHRHPAGQAGNEILLSRCQARDHPMVDLLKFNTKTAHAMPKRLR